MTMKAEDIVEMFHLCEDDEWETTAEWCGGRLVNHEVGNSGEFETELIIPRPGRPSLSGRLDDLIVRLASGEFIVYEIKRGPEFVVRPLIRDSIFKIG
jgi:hypothetical protein